MDGKGWALALGAVALIAIGAGVWWNDARRSSEGTPDGRVAPEDRARRGGEPAGRSSAGARVASGARRSVGPADAGAPAWIAPSSDTAPSESQNLDSNERELPGNAHDHEQSSGWRLGQARRRISMLESRVERYRANLRDLDPSGPASLSAERQRSLLERTEARLRELREQERELAAMARSDGTISDAERGFEEGEHETVRPPVQIPLSSP